ncbi:hypothetical protein ANN_01937 [Periplaneta americana]|uniref:Uncharacterized protein n=1 Tax=Periplaneta americana TaxID=6978 RepID=A0ABQ8TZ27_PERAM|nr:hypothetical protein ANN_01937 [Periplaneta americana]
MSSLQNLSHLSFTDRHIHLVPDVVLKPIADGCLSLQHMDLGACMFNDEDIRYFLTKKQTQLSSFRSKLCLSFESYKCLTQCKNLEHLHLDTLGHSSNNASSNIKLLRNLTNLKTLMLNDLTKEEFRAVPRLFVRGHLSNVTKLGYIAYDLRTVVKNCPQLLELTVRGTKHVLEGGFKHIGNCKNLRCLSLSGSSEVTAKCLEYVAADISDSGFTGNNFHLIPSHLVHLRELVIYACRVNDEVWDRLLKKMPHLKLTGRYVVGDDD